MNDALPQEAAILPVRDMVVFPGMIVAITVGREKSLRLVRDAVDIAGPIVIVAQRDLNVEYVTVADLYEIGTICKIHHSLQLPGDMLKIMVQGLQRVRVGPYLGTEPYLRARISPEPDQEEKGPESEAIMHNVMSQLRRYAELLSSFPEDLLTVAMNIEEPNKLCYLLGFNLPFKLAERQSLLEVASSRQKLRQLSEMLAREIAIQELGQKIQAEVQGTVGKTQREFLLREQLRAIQKELGELDERTVEIEELRQELQNARPSPEALKEAERELGRLEKLPPISPEYTVIRTYL
ncbi:MAG: LON peptidase substrate-binding domain-containing protein, partial [Cyanobacteria bacterium NC_groundwater_1444_Ag_S-0.65um_54_12]|nr:LON peptidase substrate-binding domain-containing protein [Cyanobacteria bacterium NC_groundwater_1444_Ag_S-0.65um_54_12]